MWIAERERGKIAERERGKIGLPLEKSRYSYSFGFFVESYRHDKYG